MKRTAFLLLAGLCLVAAGCGKEHRCKCTTTDIEDDGLLKIITIDGSLGCDDISEMGIENKIVSEDGVQTLERVEMHTVSCRDYADEAVE